MSAIYEVQRGDDVADVIAQEESSGGETPVSAEVDPIRALVGKRLLNSRALENALRDLDRMLLTL